MNDRLSTQPAPVPRTARIAAGLHTAARRFERLFEKLPEHRLRIDFQATFLVYHRQDRVLTGCPAIFYELAHLQRLTGADTPETTLDAILETRYPGTGGAAATPVIGPDGRRYGFPDFSHVFRAEHHDLVAVRNPLQAHNRQLVNWLAGATRLARTLHFHDLGSFCNWLDDNQATWGTPTNDLFVDPRSWLDPSTPAGAPMRPAAIAARLRSAAAHLEGCTS